MVVPDQLRRLIAHFSSGLVLALHEIRPERLEELLDCIRPPRAVPLAELVQRSKSGKSTVGLFAITVDDGVAENVRLLAQFFRTRQWPATFYLPTKYLDSGELMPFQLWRRLEPLLPRRVLQLKSGTIDLSQPGAVDRLSRKMALRWYTQRLECYLPLTTELLELVMVERGVTRPEIQVPPPIPWREVTELSKDDLIQFESHGVSHIAMSTLSEEELVFEMKHSMERISEHTGRPCRHLAYPFGGPESIGALAEATARRFYDSAVTMTLGSVDFANPWLLPRIPLYPVNSRLKMQLKVFLKCNTLAGNAKRILARPAGGKRLF